MPWHEWWPYDPVPVIPRTDPYLVWCESKKVYWWCACGRSQNQPWCDGSHKGTAFKPVAVIPKFNGPLILCGCKHGENRPRCNGTHLWVKAQRYTPQACAWLFTVMFCMGMTTTWLWHP
ncbi:unnamed protein product [Vitrella brassicaformis CCMP3155]|uniref:Iron-binding zinc finger CDGSH type domain-containing protein n=2 Tax=Vitrella brassicaformis TaxID=1169539 RepID=A0A0G4E9I3_VITBC|nr:unnamed protein product [Vitrella brassicaformis CCMP3155]|eukprot:CEL92537.1 unnamed protein product [Vitrella brassicaformis CCMP3155]